MKVGGNYEPGEGKIKQASTFVSQKGEAADLRKQNYQESLDWYAGITADVFGLSGGFCTERPQQHIAGR